MTTETLFSINRRHVVADNIDGEVIVINLENGSYFSFRGSSVVIWQHLLQGDAPSAAVVDELCARYAGAREAIADSVTAFLRCIEVEGLITSSERGSLDSANASASTPQGERTPFVDPVFEKYTDMEEFLLVDPIHEVDVSEWPRPRKRDSS